MWRVYLVHDPIAGVERICVSDRGTPVPADSRPLPLSPNSELLLNGIAAMTLATAGIDGMEIVETFLRQIRDAQ